MSLEERISQVFREAEERLKRMAEETKAAIEEKGRKISESP